MDSKGRYSKIEPVNAILTHLVNPDTTANVVRYVSSFIGVLVIGSILILIQVSGTYKQFGQCVGDLPWHKKRLSAYSIC